MSRLAWIPFAAALMVFGCTCTDPQPIPPMVKVNPPPTLGQRAFEHVRALVGFGPRFVGSKGWQQGIDYITGQLREMGLEPVVDEWLDPKEQLTFKNISVTLKGAVADKIVIGCHHDTKKCEGHADPARNFTFVGANDSGSGVGLLLELARALIHTERRATYELVFFDGEESLPWDWDPKRALFGSRHYVRRYQQARIDRPEATPTIQTFILLDMVGAKDLQIDEENKHSDKGLRDLFYAAAEACGRQAYFYANALEVTDDHVPFAEAGIRCIDLIDLEDNPHWHQATDTLEHISADSLFLVGEVVLTALPAIETRYLPRAN